MTKPVDLPRPAVAIVLPDPEPIKTLPVVWKVVKVEDTSYFAVDAQGYANAARNEADVLRWVKEAMYRLGYYAKKLSAQE